MPTKSALGVEVGDTEMEIIESTETVTSEERRFGVGNGEKEIIATAWGSEDDQNWEEIESKTVAPHSYETIMGGISHHSYVKLTGRTTTPDETSIADAYLTYSAYG